MQSTNELSHNLFRKIIEVHTTSLRTSINKWREEVTRNTNLSEDIIGEINVAAGQSELLIKERFSQFSNLIDDSEFNRSEKEVTIQDLIGFWEIILFQVERINKNFQKLQKLKENNWIVAPLITLNSKPPQAATQKGKPLVPQNVKKVSSNGGVAKSSIREHILALRKKMKTVETIEKLVEEPMKVSTATPQNEDKENETPKKMEAGMKKFDAGFFEVHTPVRNILQRKRLCEPQTPERSPPKLLASSVLKSRVLLSPIRHKDYSPCMRITRSMKKGKDLA